MCEYVVEVMPQQVWRLTKATSGKWQNITIITTTTTTNSHWKTAQANKTNWHFDPMRKCNKHATHIQITNTHAHTHTHTEQRTTSVKVYVHEIRTLRRLEAWISKYARVYVWNNEAHTYRSKFMYEYGCVFILSSNVIRVSCKFTNI